MEFTLSGSQQRAWLRTYTRRWVQLRSASLAALWVVRGISTLEATHGQIDGFYSEPHTNASSKSWHLWEIDLRFAPGLPPGWEISACECRNPEPQILDPDP